jgi:hypothetical protein
VIITALFQMISICTEPKTVTQRAGLQTAAKPSTCLQVRWPCEKITVVFMPGAIGTLRFPEKSGCPEFSIQLLFDFR